MYRKTKQIIKTMINQSYLLEQKREDKQKNYFANSFI